MTNIKDSRILHLLSIDFRIELEGQFEMHGFRAYFYT